MLKLTEKRVKFVAYFSLANILIPLFLGAIFSTSWLYKYVLIVGIGFPYFVFTIFALVIMNKLPEAQENLKQCKNDYENYKNLKSENHYSSELKKAKNKVSKWNNIDDATKRMNLILRCISLIAGFIFFFSFEQFHQEIKSADLTSENYSDRFDSINSRITELEKLKIVDSVKFHRSIKKINEKIEGLEETLFSISFDK